MSAYGVFTSKRFTVRHFSSSGPGAGAAATDTLLNKVHAMSVSALVFEPRLRNELERPLEFEFFMVRLGSFQLLLLFGAVETSSHRPRARAPAKQAPMRVTAGGVPTPIGWQKNEKPTNSAGLAGDQPTICEQPGTLRSGTVAKTTQPP